MLLIYSFPSTDEAELTASTLRRRVPLLHSAAVEESAPPPEAEPFAFFPINSLSVSGAVGNYYPTLFAYNAYVEAPPFAEGLNGDPGDPEESELAEVHNARLIVSCDERDARQVEAISRQMGGERAGVHLYSPVGRQPLADLGD